LQTSQEAQETLTTEEAESDIRLVIVDPQESIEMLTNVWKRAKPNSIEEFAGAYAPMLPEQKDSNAIAWRPATN
jgi:hypothetical protein